MFGYRKPSDLPDTVPVFPLAGALMFPRLQLPLNIFEPRYLNMVDDALAGDRLIAMIQPARTNSSEPHPPLARVGCVGRLTSFTETPDGRYLITLTGVTRFEVAHELDAGTPYRQVRLDLSRYGSDLCSDPSPMGFDRDRLLTLLAQYLDRRRLSADWAAINEAPSEPLVNTLCAMAPLDPPEKQALLEALTLEERRDMLIALMEMELAREDLGGDEDDEEPLQ